MEEFNCCIGDLGLMEYPHSAPELISDHCSVNVSMLIFQRKYRVMPCILHHKLKKMKEKLKDLNQNVFSNLSNRVIEKKLELEEYQNAIYNRDLSTQRLNNLRRLDKEYKDGDVNTQFFRTSMSKHQSQNSLLSIHYAQGNISEEYDCVVGCQSSE
ncbi:hypothetical protein LIER_39369 [Lithospermum erythrorhizon]|uniref:Uncharacterized protein n=1 Tax=Lithospermum erythrorhizon TaxID=34254 RepID=A0AAV3QDL8_LITER